VREFEDDPEAIARCQRGDVEGLAALIRRYEASALRLAWLLTGDRDLAEDITQDSFIQAWQAMARFEKGRPFLPWLQRIVTNTARMRLRSARRRREVSLTALTATANGAGEAGEVSEGDALRKEPLGVPFSQFGAGEATADPEARSEWLEQRAAIGQALAALTDKQREAVALRYYFAYSDQEIATILGCPVNTARHRVYDGLHALEQVIRRRFKWLLDGRGRPPGVSTSDHKGVQAR
jgi:RNA polymerase sigma-70 factor, ECF subfamily